MTPPLGSRVTPGVTGGVKRPLLGSLLHNPWSEGVRYDPTPGVIQLIAPSTRTRGRQTPVLGVGSDPIPGIHPSRQGPGWCP